MLNASKISYFLFFFFLRCLSNSNKSKCHGFVVSPIRQNSLLQKKPTKKKSIKAVQPPLHLNTKATNGSNISLNANKNDRNNISNDNEEGNYELQRYNDDAFGLVFLIGGFAYQDIEFAATFLILSALVAIGTSRGALNNDARIPGLVAMASLILAPIISFVRKSSGSVLSLLSLTSLDMIEIQFPSTVEIGVCLISLILGIYKWKKEKEKME